MVLCKETTFKVFHSSLFLHMIPWTWKTERPSWSFIPGDFCQDLYKHEILQDFYLVDVAGAFSFSWRKIEDVFKDSGAKRSGWKPRAEVYLAPWDDSSSKWLRRFIVAHKIILAVILPILVLSCFPLLIFEIPSEK